MKKLIIIALIAGSLVGCYRTHDGRRTINPIKARNINNSALVKEQLEKLRYEAEELRLTNERLKIDLGNAKMLEEQLRKLRMKGAL